MICLIRFLELGDTSLSIFSKSALKYAIRKVGRNQKGLKLNGPHQVLVYADDINLLGEDTNIRDRNKDAPLDGSKEVGDTDNSTYVYVMFSSCHQSAGQNLNIRTTHGPLQSSHTLERH
jgi:hypothetical protein